VASNVFTISSTNGLTIGTEFVSSAIAGTPGLIAQTSYYISLISGNTIVTPEPRQRIPIAQVEPFIPGCCRGGNTASAMRIVPGRI
jgi:hypothetical protein